MQFFINMIPSEIAITLILWIIKKEVDTMKWKTVFFPLWSMNIILTGIYLWFKFFPDRVVIPIC